MIPPCPHCGDNSQGFYTRGQIRGPIEFFYNERGKYTETSNDKTWSIQSKTVRCGNCDKPRRDLIVKDNWVCVDAAPSGPRGKDGE